MIASSPRLLFSGFYGMGNAGDEAVLESLIQLCREQSPGVAIDVLSGDPAGTERDNGVSATPRMSPRAVLAALRAADLFISGGGSLLQDATSAQSLLYYLGLILLARVARRRTIILAQGIGPIRRPALRQLTGRIVAGVDHITVRDPDSAEELRRLGVGTGGRPPIEVTADPVFALTPAPVERVRERVGEGGGPLLGISLRPWPGIESIRSPLVEAVTRGIAASGARVLFLPLQPEVDGPICRGVSDRIPGSTVLEGRLLAPEWPALMGCLDLVVAMRLHALIFAASANVSLLGISYDPKIDSLLSRLSATPAATADRLDPSMLAARIETALSDRAAERPSRAAVEALRVAARRNAAVIFERVPAPRNSDRR